VLVLETLPELRQLQGLQGCPALQIISVSGCPNLAKLDLEGLSRLEQLHLSGCGGLQQVACPVELAALSRLVVADCRHLQTVECTGASALPTLSNLCVPQVRLSALYQFALDDAGPSKVPECDCTC
jgi:hypothetical protein